MPLQMLYRGNAATCAISRQCRLWMQCRFMCYIWRQCRNVFHIWRQCRDMAAMPRHVLHPVHRGNAAANDRRSHVYARMHTCTHVLSFVCTHEKPNTTAAMMARMRMRSQSQWARIITLSARLPITLSAPPKIMIDAVMSMHACTHVHMFCDFYAHTKSQTPLPLESQPRAYVIEKLNIFETCLQRKIP